MAREAELEDMCFSKPAWGGKGPTQEVGTLSEQPGFFSSEKEGCFPPGSEWGSLEPEPVPEQVAKDLGSLLLLPCHLGPMPGTVFMLQARKRD